MYLLNAFSVSMLDLVGRCQVEFEPIPIAEARKLCQGATSAVGHAATARLFSEALGSEIAFNRASVFLSPGSVALLGQYVGPRLDEGATELPFGAVIRWVRVTVK